MVQTDVYVQHFPKSFFVDYYVSDFNLQYGRVLWILSVERDKNGNIGYFNHMFRVKNEVLRWHLKQQFP